MIAEQPAGQPQGEALRLTVRALTADDWRSLRAIRLHALRTELGLFFKHYDDEAALTDDAWIARATGDNAGQIFGLFAGETLVGISAVYTEADDLTGGTAGFGMSYILPEYRSRGLAARFYEARLAWAVARPQFVRAAVGHRRSNEASRRLIARFGFRWVRDVPHQWPDGETEDDVCYELPLRRVARHAACSDEIRYR